MSTRSKHHHFVPQSLLRNFRNNPSKDKIFVFDKTTLESFPNSIRTTGSEKYFHSIRRGESEFNFEDYFQKPDGYYAKIIAKIVSNKSLKVLNEEEQDTLIVIMAFQILRTRKRVNELINMSAFFEKVVEKITGEYGIPRKNVSPQVKTLNDDEARIQLLNLHDEINHFADILADKVVMLNIATENYPFWCSDNPVVYNNTLPFGDQGIASTGTSVYFPISPTLCIALECKAILINSFHKEKREHLAGKEHALFESMNFGLSIECQQDHVDYVNSLLVRESNRFVYSNEDKFDMARRFLSEFPKYRCIDLDGENLVNNVNSASKYEFSRMPDGQYLILEYVNDFIPLKVIVKDEDNWIFEIENDVDLDAVMKHEKIEIVRYIVDKHQSFLARDMKIFRVDGETNTFRLDFTNSHMKDALKSIKNNNATSSVRL